MSNILRPEGWFKASGTGTAADPWIPEVATTVVNASVVQMKWGYEKMADGDGSAANPWIPLVANDG